MSILVLLKYKMWLVVANNRMVLKCSCVYLSVNDPCRNHGVCVPPTAAGNPPSCVCLDGYEGRFCEIDINECFTQEITCSGKGAVIQFYPFLSECSAATSFTVKRSFTATNFTVNLQDKLTT